MMGNVLGMKYGQEQITQINYYDFVNGSIDPFKTIKIDSFEKLQGPITFRTQATTLIASDTNAIPVVLNGYNLETELKYSKLNTILPFNFKFNTPFPIILGRRLAEILSVHEGSKIAVIGQAMDGSVANELFTVEKILDLGGGEFDKTYAITNLESMQSFLSLSRNSAHILVNFGDEIPRHKISKQFEIINWKNLLPEIASSSGFMQRFTRFYAIFFSLVASLALINTVSLSFLERVNEYRTCLIIGSPHYWLKTSMGIEIVLITGLSLLLGNILILLAICFFNFFPLNLSILTGGEPLHMGGMVMTQNVDIRPETWIFLSINALFMLTQFLASIYPMKIIMKKSQRIS
jgi:ABC-type lipoprotein release transport system permease subunit